MLTVHEVRKIDFEIAFVSVIVGEEAIVHKLPTKSIRNNDDNAFDGSPLSWLTDVRVQAVLLDVLALWLAIMNMAGKTVGARHG